MDRLQKLINEVLEEQKRMIEDDQIFYNEFKVLNKSF
jgi:hypothetical protein